MNRKATKSAHADRAANSFEVVAREWFAKFEPKWAATHSSKIIRRLECDVFPWIGARPITEINAPEVLACLRRVEARGALDTAHGALQNCGQVFATPWLPDALSAILRAICAGHCRPPNTSTSRPSRNRQRPGNCCAPSMDFAARLSCNVPCALLRWCLCAPAVGAD